MADAKAIKRRIRSASNMKQIISAMELVSVVKMQKAVNKDLTSRVFTDTASRMLSQVCGDAEMASHPLLTTNGAERQLVITISSDRGLCGALNNRIIKETSIQANEVETDFIVIGKKVRDFCNHHCLTVLSEYEEMGDNLEFARILPIIQQAVEAYLAGTYHSVKVIYTHFESSLSQIPKVVQLLPFEVNVDCLRDTDVIFEPDKHEIINTLVPRIVETQLWQYLLEAAASEHSARMMAMKNASDNAEDLIYDLTLSYNQTRQAGITREIAEISAGKMTLEG